MNEVEIYIPLIMLGGVIVYVAICLLKRKECSLLGTVGAAMSCGAFYVPVGLFQLARSPTRAIELTGSIRLALSLAAICTTWVALKSIKEMLARLLAPTPELPSVDSTAKPRLVESPEDVDCRSTR
jgi:hypothetical protein